jgi:hypothetical protein
MKKIEPEPALAGLKAFKSRYLQFLAGHHNFMVVLARTTTAKCQTDITIVQAIFTQPKRTLQTQTFLIKYLHPKKPPSYNADSVTQQAALLQSALFHLEAYNQSEA